MIEQELRNKIAKHVCCACEMGLGDGECAERSDYRKCCICGDVADALIEVIKEYKRRAARAERALKNACEDVKMTVSFLIELSERVDGLRVEGYLPEESEPKAYINRAEKELAEEEKDD